MVEVNILIDSIELVISWPIMGWIILGLLIGIILGSLPGIGPALGMAIFLPLSLAFEPVIAIFFLIAIYNGAMYGGSIAAIIVNAPGTPSNAATTFDGYPMSRSGQSVTALSISAVSSSIGGILTCILVLPLTPYITEMVLMFGSPEYFLVAILGLVLITIVARGSMMKGLVMGFFGLLLSSIGQTVVTVQPRYTFGVFALYDGVNFIIVLIGVFAISEAIKLSGEGGSISKGSIELSGSVIGGIREVLSNYTTVVKSTLIGLGIGSIPGAGATISNFVAYGEAVRTGENPESFGEGNPQGVIATEASNNATVTGSLIPTLAFGIPGSGTTAIFLGALLSHGFRPGPNLFTENLIIVYGLFISLMMGGFVILIIGTTLVIRAGYITEVDTKYIIPVIIVLSFIGIFSLQSQWIDILLLSMFGVMGYIMDKYDYSVIALVLGVILGPIAEENLHRTMQLAGGSWTYLASRPLSLVLIMVILLILFSPVISRLKNIYVPNMGG